MRRSSERRRTRSATVRLGVLIVNGPLQHRNDRLVPFGVDVGAEHLPIPVVHIKREHAQKLFRGTGQSLTSLQRRIDERLSPSSFEISDTVVNLVVDVRRNLVEVSNVLGYLPPSGRDEPQHVVIGAHYDHLGLGERGSRDRGAQGKIHNGADDNASGVAGLLELARLFKDTENRPRGLIFAAFAGEELGLRGSDHYTSNPVYPLEDTVAMINLDMIGRLRHDRLFIGGVDLIPQIARKVDEATRAHELSVTSRFPAEGASDHAPFIRSGVPALFFFTGLHGDYHKPSDDMQFINLDGMAKVLAVGYEVSDYLMRVRERPMLAANLSPAGSSGYTSRRAATNAAYFGVGMDGAFQGEGVRFSYVADDGPAAAAGLRAGDVLLELNGQSVRSSERASIILRQHRPGQTIRAKVRRNGEVLEISIRLSRWP